MRVRDVSLPNLGRLSLREWFQDVRNEKNTKNSEAALCKIENPLSESSVPACSQSWFLEQLDPGQIGHFRDWLLINSTCRRFRAWGKSAFFSEKIFLVRPRSMERLCRNIPSARRLIRHVIALLPPVRNPFYALPQYQALERLRSLVIQRDYPDSRILLMPNGSLLE